MMKKNFTQLLLGAMLMTSVVAAAQEGLFISEIADPGDEYTGRFIELFNAGSESVDFTNIVFYLSRQSNGGATWGEVQLTGSVAAGATYVIGGSAFESFYGFAPDLVTGILTGNGDDPYSLYEGGGHATGMLHDIYGDEKAFTQCMGCINSDRQVIDIEIIIAHTQGVARQTSVNRIRTKSHRVILAL